MDQFLAILLILAVVQGYMNPTYSDKYIDFINSQQNTWKAGSKFPQNRFQDYFTSRLSLQLQAFDQRLPVLEQFTNSKGLPFSFDSRDKWPNCTTINDIRDQSSCDASWAFAPAEVISDRICIHSGTQEIFRVSPEELIECCTECAPFGGCNSGFVHQAFIYWVDNGLVSGYNYNDTETCLPFGFPSCNVNHKTCKKPVIRKCRHKCQDSYKIPFQKDKHYGRFIYSINNDEKSIMNEIIENGPVQAAMIIHPDFFLYESGVYSHVDKTVLGGHAVKIIGWGEEHHIPFWTVANSMGENYGEGGFIRVLRGSNECAIESNVNAGIPKQKYYD